MTRVRGHTIRARDQGSPQTASAPARSTVAKPATLPRGERRIALAILTEHSPSHSYGKRTLRGVAKRLTRDLRLEAETP